MLDNYTTGKLVLKKNPNFYDPKQQKLAGIEFINMTQGPPAVSALAGRDRRPHLVDPARLDRNARRGRLRGHLDAQ